MYFNQSILNVAACSLWLSIASVLIMRCFSRLRWLLAQVLRQEMSVQLQRLMSRYLATHSAMHRVSTEMGS